MHRYFVCLNPTDMRLEFRPVMLKNSSDDYIGARLLLAKHTL